MAQAPAFKRVLLKLSGEALMGDDAYGINRTIIERIISEIAEVVALGVEVAVVIGGGNIFRGVAGGSVGMDRATADYMGMLATVMNSLALADTMDKVGLTTKKSWGLKNIHDLCNCGNVLLVVNIGQDRQVQRFFDLGQDLQTFLHPWPSKAHARGAEDRSVDPRAQVG